MTSLHRRVHLATAVVCLAAVALALVAQHGFGMEPCPWCILQRVVFLVIAVVSLAAAVLPSAGRRVLHALIALLAAGGLAAAVYQNQVAAKSASCDLSLAERWLATVGLDRWSPDVFEIRAGCADAAVSILGVPFEGWSGLLFALIAGTAVWALTRRSRRP